MSKVKLKNLKYEIPGEETPTYGSEVLEGILGTILICIVAITLICALV